MKIEKIKNKKYLGQLEDGVENGQGVKYNIKGDVLFEGTFKNGKKCSGKGFIKLFSVEDNIRYTYDGLLIF